MKMKIVALPTTSNNIFMVLILMPVHTKYNNYKYISVLVLFILHKRTVMSTLGFGPESTEASCSNKATMET